MVKLNNNNVNIENFQQVRQAELAVYSQLDKLNKCRALSKQDQNVLETLKAKGVNTKLYEIEQDLQDVESGLTQLRSVVDDVKQERAKQTVKQQFFDQNDALKSPVAIQEILDNDTTYDLDKEQENTANSEGLKALLSAIYQLNQTVQSKSRQNKQAKQKFCKQIENHVYQYLIGEITASDLQLYLTDLQASKPEKSSELKKLVADIESNKECLKSNQFPFNDPFNVKESKPLTVSLNIDQSVSEAWDEFQELKGEFLDSHSDSTEDEMEDEKNPFESFNEAYKTLLKSPYEDDENEKLTKNDFEILSVPFNFLMESFDRFSQKAKSFFGENNSQKFNEAEQQALQKLLNSSLNTETDQPTFKAIQNYIKATGAELEPKEKLLVSIKNLQCQRDPRSRLKKLCDSVLQNPENIYNQTLLKVACHKGTDKQSFGAIQTYLDNDQLNHTQQLFLNIKQLQLSAQNNNEVKQICGSILQYATKERVERNANFYEPKFYELLSQLSSQIASDPQLQAGKEAQFSIEKEFSAPIYSYLHSGGDVSESVKALVANVSAGFLSQIGGRYKEQKPNNNDAHDRLKVLLGIKEKNLTDQDQQELAIINSYLKSEVPKSDGMSEGEEPEVDQGPENPNANDPVKNNGSSLKDNKTSYGRGSRKNGESILNDGSARSDPSSGSATTASTEEAGEGSNPSSNSSGGTNANVPRDFAISPIEKAIETLENAAGVSFDEDDNDLVLGMNSPDSSSLNKSLTAIQRDLNTVINASSERPEDKLQDPQQKADLMNSLSRISDTVSQFKPYNDNVFWVSHGSQKQYLTQGQLTQSKILEDRDRTFVFNQVIHSEEENPSVRYDDLTIKRIDKHVEGQAFYQYQGEGKHQHKIFKLDSHLLTPKKDETPIPNLIQRANQKRLDLNVGSALSEAKRVYEKQLGSNSYSAPDDQHVGAENSDSNGVKYDEKLYNKDTYYKHLVDKCKDSQESSGKVTAQDVIELLYGGELGRHRFDNNTAAQAARNKMIECLNDKLQKCIYEQNKDDSSQKLKNDNNAADNQQSYKVDEQAFFSKLFDQQIYGRDTKRKRALCQQVYKIVKERLYDKGNKSNQRTTRDAKATDILVRLQDLLNNNRDKQASQIQDSIKQALDAKYNNDDIKSDDSTKAFVDALTSQRGQRNWLFWTKESKLTSTGAQLHEAFEENTISGP